MASAVTESGSSNVAVSQEDDLSKYVVHDLIMKFAVSMTLKVALQLGIPDILASAKGKPLTAEEILTQMPTKSTPGPNSVINLTRLLRPLLQHGVFSESFNDEKQPVYGLTEISKWFVKDNEFNLAPLGALLLRPSHQTPFLEQLHKLILDDNVLPFTESSGCTIYQYVSEDSEFETVFLNGMTSYRAMESGLVNNLQRSGALEGVGSLVDVGGGTGVIVAEIVAKNPHIRGINFDLPNVIANAPKMDGVEHVPGNFFESVPSGDAIFLKTIVHNYGDEDAIRILQNCFQALPKGGKVIISEYVMTDWRDPNPKARMADNMDLLMFVLFKQARERTKEEFERIVSAAGFSRCKVMHNPRAIDLILGFKD